jgi:RNA polymerase sigma-70 factor (ECF subfamily)
MAGDLDSDERLVLRVQEGDPAAFECLVQKYRQRIVKLASRMLGDFTEAEDLAQNVFVRAFTQSRRFRFQSRFSTWLYAIARNLCRNELRRRSRHWVGDLSGLRDGDGEPGRWEFTHARSPSPPDTLVEQELEQRLQEALTSLPEKQRAAMLLVWEGDTSYEQIALQLGHSLSATKTLIHRGRHTLRRKLQFGGLPLFSDL